MYSYTLKDNEKKEDLHFETDPAAFYPTDTSTLLIKASRQVISLPKKILDLGCGVGVVGLVMARLGYAQGPLFGSDINEKAILLAQKNARQHNIPCDYRVGSLFEPWEGESFDVIIDDVAGISDDIAKLSGWYPSGVECNAGRDGTKWIINIIKEADQYLSNGGMIIFPTLSLSNEEKILQEASQRFVHHELILKQDWFVPDDLLQHKDLLMDLMADGSIRCEEKFGRLMWSTSVYRAWN